MASPTTGGGSEVLALKSGVQSAGAHSWIQTITTGTNMWHTVAGFEVRTP